jgi:ABC-type multidrug transport system ATPase subunit
VSIPEFKVDGLSVVYERTNATAIKDLSLSIAKNSLNFILGQNGSGKSTLIRCLAGHQYWNKGEIYRNGESRGKDRKLFNDGMHFVSEEIVLPNFPISSLKNVYYEIWGEWHEEVFDRIMELNGIPQNRRPSQLSRGQRIQVQLALALATRPQVILVDEATAALDPYMRNRIVNELTRANREWGTTVVLSTNIATELRGLEGDVTIMSAGTVKLAGHSTEIRNRFVKLLIATEDLNQAVSEGFTLLNSAGEVSTVIGFAEGQDAVKFAAKVDRRETMIDEIFIFFSERRAA